MRRKLVTLHTPMMLKLFTAVLNEIVVHYPDAVVESGEDYVVWSEPAPPDIGGQKVVPCATT
jgi:hypothetical protein